MKYKSIIFEIFLSVFFFVFASPFLWAGEPGDVVKKVISKDISLKDGEDTKVHREEIWREIAPCFYFEEMAERAMGKYWRERSSVEKKEFTELFAKNIKSSYMRTHGPRFGEKKIISLAEEQENGYARVQVDLIKRTDENATADFRLIRKDGEWRICDVVFEGVSLIHNFRSQIYSFMNRSSYEELVKTFKQKHNKE